MKENKKGIGFKHAWNGLKVVWLHERNFRIHFVVAIIVIICGIYVKLTRIEWSIIMLTISAVFITELVNSLFERMIDYFKPEYHFKAKQIKDIGAAAVLITAIMAVIIGIFIFYPKINALF